VIKGKGRGPWPQETQRWVSLSAIVEVRVMSTCSQETEANEAANTRIQLEKTAYSTVKKVNGKRVDYG
jgi:hypothetical protein